MSRRTFSYRALEARPAEPFRSPAEAWFWGMRCLAARADGARFRAGLGEVARPCEPDDLLATVEQLTRARRLRAAHIRTLFRFGRRLAAPDGRRRDEEHAARWWDEAFDRIGPVWRAKGIVA